ncbi:hypothetical protein N8639_01245 [bacterium]|jgi:hypothetical protein|nr:hypothetical protein [bacterium]MDB4631995.1 hypothetical protein [bacterium]
MCGKVYYVGTGEEVAHHARPLASKLDVEIISSEKVADVATNRDLAIFFSEHFRRFRTAINQLKQKGCRTLYAIDGILEWRNAFETQNEEPACPWTMRPVLSEKVAAIGRSQARQLSFWGNRKKIELIGLPRLDDLANFEKQNPLRQLTSKKHLIVMTAKWPGYTDEQILNVEESLFDLKKALDFMKERVDVTWRLTGGLAEKLGVVNSFSNANGDEFHQQLKECDALITTPSTAILEGMSCGIPTAILEYNDCPQLTDSVWQIRTERHLKKVLNELLNPPESKLAQQDFVLHDTLECHSAASNRLVDLIDKMFTFPAGEMPESLVPIDETTIVGQLDHQFLFSHHKLFETNNVLELQAHAAELERDDNRLQERNELLEREFNRAKATIDNVFNNPFVSPFLKAGDLAAKLLKKPAS